MDQIELIHILLGLIILLLLAVFMRLGSVFIQMQSNQSINNAYNDDHHRQRGELLQTQNESLSEIHTDIQQIRSEVEDLKYVSDIFYKYRLPDKREREELDRIAVDNEVFGGITRARDDNT